MRVILWDIAGNRRPEMWLTSADGKVSHTSGYYSKYDDTEHPFKNALKKLMDQSRSNTGHAARILHDRDAIFEQLNSSIRINNGVTADDLQFAADSCGIRIRLY